MMNEKNTMTWEQTESLKSKASELCKMYKVETDNLMIEGQIDVDEWVARNSKINDIYSSICKKISHCFDSRERITEQDIEDVFISTSL